MAKKQDDAVDVQAANAAVEKTSNEQFLGGLAEEAKSSAHAEDTGIGGLVDFDLETDVKEIPYAVPGIYMGAITGTKLDTKNFMIKLEITLNGNGGVLSDEETPADGYVYSHRIFLPKPGDELEYTKNGAQTKRTWKINNLAKSLDALGIPRESVRTAAQLAEAIGNGDWVGIEVVVDLDIQEYQGTTSNQAKSVALRTS